MSDPESVNNKRSLGNDFSEFLGAILFIGGTDKNGLAEILLTTPTAISHYLSRNWKPNEKTQLRIQGYFNLSDDEIKGLNEDKEQVPKTFRTLSEAILGYLHAGYTYKQIAKICGVSPITISEYLTRKTVPSDESIDKLRRTLGHFDTVEPKIQEKLDVSSPGNRNCVDHNPNIFYPSYEDEVGVALAKSICAGCSVAKACLAYAISIDDRYGIFGGLTPQERNDLS